MIRTPLSNLSGSPYFVNDGAVQILKPEVECVAGVLATRFSGSCPTRYSACCPTTVSGCCRVAGVGGCGGGALCARDSGVFAAVFTALESGGGVFHSLYLVFHHHIGIDCGGADVGVPQQRLCGLDVAYSRLHERGECVACHVEMDIFCDSHFLGYAFQ